MRDFSITNVRQEEIRGKQSVDGLVQKHEDQELSNHLFSLNKEFRDGAADRQSRTQSSHAIRQKALFNTINYVPEDKVDRFAEPSCGPDGLINTFILDRRIQGITNLGDKIKATRAEALNLEDDVILSQTMMETGEYDKLAASHISMRGSN